MSVLSAGRRDAVRRVERSSLLDIDKIRELVQMMVVNDLVEISLRDGEEEVNLRRPSAQGIAMGSEPMPRALVAAPLAAAPLTPADAPVDDAVLLDIKSPMVGTFYSAPDPESPPFVQIGSQVHPGMVVCILEAMKVFNEIKAEIAGTIERIMVKNAQPVEYGQTLYQVRPT